MKLISMPLCMLLIWIIGHEAFTADLQFTPDQLVRLKASGRDIIVPRYLPNGFKVKKVMVDRSHPTVPSYSILFAGPDHQCFFVEMSSEVGDTIIEDGRGNEVEPISEIQNPILGNAFYWRTQEFFGTDWFAQSRKQSAYRVIGDVGNSAFLKDKMALKICKKRIDVIEFVKVAGSLGV